MPDPMIAFLREQLNADEIGALAACWKGSSNTPNWHAPFSATLDTGGDTIHIGDRAVTNHIARHDPARVLRDIKFKRAMLNACATTLDFRDAAADRIRAAGGNPTAKDLDDWARAATEATVMHDLVRDLAAVYADRDGYRPEWAPDA